MTIQSSTSFFSIQPQSSAAAPTTAAHGSHRHLHHAASASQTTVPATASTSAGTPGISIGAGLPGFAGSLLSAIGLVGSAISHSAATPASPPAQPQPAGNGQTTPRYA